MSPAPQCEDAADCEPWGPCAPIDCTPNSCTYEFAQNGTPCRPAAACLTGVCEWGDCEPAGAVPGCCTKDADCGDGVTLRTGPR